MSSLVAKWAMAEKKFSRLAGSGTAKAGGIKREYSVAATILAKRARALAD